MKGEINKKLVKLLFITCKWFGDLFIDVLYQIIGLCIRVGKTHIPPLLTELIVYKKRLNI